MMISENFNSGIFIHFRRENWEIPTGHWLERMISMINVQQQISHSELKALDGVSVLYLILWCLLILCCCIFLLKILFGNYLERLVWDLLQKNDSSLIRVPRVSNTCGHVWFSIIVNRFRQFYESDFLLRFFTL